MWESQKVWLGSKSQNHIKLWLIRLWFKMTKIKVFMIILTINFIRSKVKYLSDSSIELILDAVSLIGGL